jgi:RHS repeat-associated protein
MPISFIYDADPRFVFSAYIYTGKERDTESGLDYFGARYYGSSMGKWSSPDPSGLLLADPLNPQSFNLYSYVGNNPVRFFDPDGLSKDCGGGGDKSVVCLVTSAWDWLSSHVGGGGGGGNGGGGNPPPGWGLTPPSSGHYVTVGSYPAGAGWMGHVGVGLDTPKNTLGWATQKKHPFVLYLTGLPFAGQLKVDTDTYSDRMSGLATPTYFYRSISDQKFDAMQSAIGTRDGKDTSKNIGNYDLYFRNCAQFVEDVLHAGGISGIPHNEIFAPLGLRLLLEMESHVPH